MALALAAATAVRANEDRAVMTECMTAWQCTGCGRIEGAQPCVGICQDRKMDFIYAADYDLLRAELTRMCRRTETLIALTRQLACTTPRAGACERTSRALQVRARRVLQGLAGDDLPWPA